jgi:hypothetical protein
MTTIDFMISRVTGDEIPRFCADDLAEARTLVLSHLFRFSTWLEFNEAFESRFGMRWTYADREILLTDPLVMRHLRFILYRVVFDYGHASVKVIKAEALAAGLDEHDLPLLRLCIERLLPQFERHRSMGFRPLTLRQFDAELSLAWKANTRFVAGYAWTHLRFLVHWNLTLDHIQADLSGKAIAILMEMFPTFKNRGHLHTIYRSVVQQLALKMIKRYRSQKRSIMDSDNFKSCVSLDVQVADGDIDLHSFIGDSAAHENMERKVEAGSLAGRLCEFEYGSVLVRLLCGEHTAHFLSWMRNMHHVANLETYAERYPAQYLRRCLDYCGIDPDAFSLKVGKHGLISSS